MDAKLFAPAFAMLVRTYEFPEPTSKCITEALRVICLNDIDVARVSDSTGTVKISLTRSDTDVIFGTVVVHQDGKRLARFDRTRVQTTAAPRNVDKHVMRAFVRFVHAMCIENNVARKLIACMCMRNMERTSDEFVCAHKDAKPRVMLVVRGKAAQQRLEPVSTDMELQRALGVYADLFKMEDFGKILNVREPPIEADLRYYLRRVDNVDIGGQHVCERLPWAEVAARKRQAIHAIATRFGLPTASDDLLMALVAFIMRDWLCNMPTSRIKRTPLLCFRSLRVMRAVARALYGASPIMIDRDQLRVSSIRAHRLTTQGGTLLYKGEIDGASARALHSMATCRSVCINKSITSAPCDTDRMMVAMHDPRLRAFVAVRDAHEDGTIVLCEDGHDEDTSTVVSNQTRTSDVTNADTDDDMLCAVKRYIACVTFAKAGALMRADRWRDVQRIFGLRITDAHTRLAWFPLDADMDALLRDVHASYGMRYFKATELMSLVRRHVNDHRTNRKSALMPCVLTRECCNRNARLQRKRVMDIASGEGNLWVVPIVRLIRSTTTDRYQLRQIREMNA